MHHPSTDDPKANEEVLIECINISWLMPSILAGQDADECIGECVEIASMVLPSIPAKGIDLVFDPETDCLFLRTKLKGKNIS
jgi:hypothetical protein